MKYLLILFALLSAACSSLDQQKPPLDHGPRATSTPVLNQQIYGR